MTDAVHELVDTYRLGLDAELDVLDTLLRLAVAQDEASAVGDSEALLALLDQRSSALSRLLEIERELAAPRAGIAGRLERVPGCSEPPLVDICRLHRVAEERLSLIDGHDRRTLERLARTEASRRDSSQMLDAAEATLAAYRKALAPDRFRSGLIDRVG